MASINTGEGGKRGRKPLDSEIPLIPFIDLLLCCVMFLLVTAVWNEISGMDAAMQGPPTPDAVVPDDRDELPLTVEMGTAGYVLSSAAGDRIEIPRTTGGYDLVALRERLEERRRLAPAGHGVQLAPDDDVHHVDLVATMDVLIGTGYQGVTMSGL